jgi:hypothetical protein
MLNILIISTICIKLILTQEISSCPKYQCQNTTNTTCAYVASATDTGAKYNQYSLFDVCGSNQFCTAQPLKSLQDATNSTTFDCADSIFDVRRYPGEDCNKNYECNASSRDSHCDKSNKCTGSDIGEHCHDHSNCLVGLFCNYTSATCTKQRLKGETCKTSLECPNSLLCFNGTCSVAPFSIPVDTQVPDDDVYFAGYFCNRRQVYYKDFSDAYCGELKQTVPEGEEYVKCNYGEQCDYSLGPDGTTLDCQCGFNTDGQGYCPQGQNLSKYTALMY